MIPPLLEELKEGRFKFQHLNLDIGNVFNYRTESGWTVTIVKSLFTIIWVNGEEVSWFYGLRIKRAIKKGIKHER